MASRFGGFAPDLDLEEKLFVGIIDGPLLPYEGLLENLRDVDVRGIRQQTLLHVATKVGRLDWVEKLVGMGADPCLRDSDDVTVLDLALEMSCRYPNDSERLNVLRTVKLVSERNLAMGRVRGGNGRPVHAYVGGVATPGSEHVLETLLSYSVNLSRGMASLNSAVAQCMTRSHAELSSVKEAIKSLSKDLGLLAEVAKGVKAGGRKPARKSITKTSAPGTKKKKRKRKKKAKASTSDGVVPINAEPETSVPMPEPKSPAGDSETGLILRDMLYKLAVISNGREPPLSSKERVGTKLCDVVEDCRRLSVSIAGNLQGLSGHCESIVRYNCVEALMAKTEVINADEVKLTRVRSMYKELYSTGTMTWCLLTFLHCQELFKILIDCDSFWTEGKKKKNKILQGDECYGSIFGTQAGVRAVKVYLGSGSEGDRSAIGWLGVSLAQMSMYLAFDNEGKPHAAGDLPNQSKFGKVLSDAKAMIEQSAADNMCDVYIGNALTQKTNVAKRIHLISAVPGMVAEYGFAAIPRLRLRLPSLLDYYEQQVVTTLLNNWRVQSYYMMLLATAGDGVVHLEQPEIK